MTESKLKMPIALEPFLLSTITPAAGVDTLFKALLARDAARYCCGKTALDCLPTLLDTRSVIFASDDLVLLREASGLPGVLPIHVTQGRQPSVAEKFWITVSGIDQLEYLFDGSLSPLLDLLHIDVAEVSDATEKMASEFHRLVAAAGGLHIFGAGTIGRQALHECRAHHVAVCGFVDNDVSRRGQAVEELPIKAPTDLNPVQDVVVVSVGNHAEAITRQLKSMGFAHVVNLSQFFFAVGSDGQPECGYLDDLASNRIRWIAFALSLGDDRSRQVISAVVRHRLTLDTSYLAEVRDGDIPQWFDPSFLSPDRQAVFVDGGAFDGDTVEGFRNFNGPARRIHAFELDPEIASRANKRLAAFPEVVVHSLGLSDRRTMVPFLRTGITDGRLGSDATNSENVVEVVSVDEAVSEAVTFLKLDVEGAEARAISGAARQIGENAPTIGLAVYHKPSDPWSLPLQISNLNAAYRFYLRHYTDLAFETVVYAVAR